MYIDESLGEVGRGGVAAAQQHHGKEVCPLGSALDCNTPSQDSLMLSMRRSALTLPLQVARALGAPATSQQLTHLLTCRCRCVTCLDHDAAFRAACALLEAACVLIEHTNPCSSCV